MRVGLVTLGVLVVSACTRVNPAYDGGDGEAASSGAELTTELPPPETSADVTETGADVTGTGADATAGADATETDACATVHEETTPEKDTFLVWCDGDACAENNFGVTELAPIEDGVTYRSHLLMTFDTSKVVTEAGNNLVAKLSFSVQNAAAISVMAYQTPPIEWTEGMGDNQTAATGEAAWSWSARPTLWTASGNTLDGYGGLVPLSTHFVPLAVEGFETRQRVEIPIPQQVVDGWIAAPGIVHLGLTATGSDAIAGSSESSEPPRLIVDGC